MDPGISVSWSPKGTAGHPWGCSDPNEMMVFSIIAFGTDWGLSAGPGGSGVLGAVDLALTVLTLYCPGMLWKTEQHLLDSC